ncbi:MAG: peptidylprolyl isomerase [Betaproteobacteria bacterium]|jgi:FKBP-type peptidyl-prolyl cis-trans isomerase SlyD|uniref:FKBP-type peptidyl-prolyl cis-trans isomerase n=1 Tax=Thiomonas sp. TaxID=2047785 RepID=UPI000BCC5647|nr:peptidylprolyl isomerase [Thiomonas sp.]MDE2128645.1 peptidylprolyl isomerase [Betaproteobacteria bacterium]OZB54660.1 MAG: peptidylprolyl isomerase [Thiomonas sp. 14-66-4]
MQAALDTVVTLAWQLTDAQNEPIADDAEGTDFYVGGADLLPQISQHLLGKQAGASGQLQIEPHDAFGDYEPTLLRIEDRALFPEVLEPGMQFEHLPPGCRPGESGVIYTVSDIAEGKVVLDGNHPLAGMALRVSYTILDVREPDPDEREAQSAHLDDVDSGMFLAGMPRNAT